MFAIGILLAAFTLQPLALAEPIGSPGIPHRWAPALKDAIGTSYEETTAQSPVWFTVAEGILSEVFYPTVDQAQIGDFQFLVTDGKNYFSGQQRDTIYKVDYLDEGMAVRITGQERGGRYSYEQTLITDPAAPVVRIKTTLHWNVPKLRVFLLFKPAINNTGSGNLASASPDGLFATRQAGSLRKSQFPVQVALVASSRFLAESVGYAGFSDGWQDVSKNFKITEPSHEAGPGNVALTGELPVGAGTDYTYEVAIGFGQTRDEALTYAQTSLGTSFEHVQAGYESGWKGYLNSLQNSPLNQGKRFISESTFARRSAEIIKMHEDKRNPGALVASLSSPGIPDGVNALDGTGGYHLVWPRDLYHAAMGLLAAGDTRTPVSVLRYYLKTQKTDGSWPQNYWVDGSPYWLGLQMDEVSFPILLAAQLKKHGVHAPAKDELEMIRRAAAFIMSHGPMTQEDRWEEIGGYVPSTLAAEIAALRTASMLTGDAGPAQTADHWQSLIERWTLVPNGVFGSNYYLRASPGGNPGNPEPINIANGGGPAYASDILDGGFLDLVRMGIRGPNDPRILSTLRIYEMPEIGIAKADSSGVLTFKRYNRDAYGPSHQGGYWPLLAGERGHYAVAANQTETARAELFLVEKSAVESGLLPEQTLTPPPATGHADIDEGIACPLVWAHAEDILLHRSIEEGTVFDSPAAAP